MNATNILPDNNGRALVLATVLALSMVALAAAFSGGAAASQHDVDVSFNDTEGDVGDQVAVSFDIDPANAPTAEVGAYDVEINYDETVLSFVEMNGVDLSDPVTNEPSPGTITANVGQATGEPVPLTAANVVFEIDQGAPDGEVATISLNDANSQFNDPVNPVTFQSQNGSVTVGATDSDYQLSNLVPQDATVTQGGEPITVSADVTNEGTEAGDQTVVLEVSNQSGVVFSDSQSGIQVGPGETQTVSFQGVPAGTLDLGDYTHSISTNEDSISGSLTVQEEPDFVVGPGLDIEITDGLTIGDDYPLNFDNLGGDVYDSTSPINTPTAVDERYAPFIEGQHVGITGLPVQTDTYEWVADQGLLGSSTASQTVEASFEASAGSVSLGYSQSIDHGLAPADLQVAEVAGIDPADLNLDIGTSGVDITYDPADATADDIQVRFNIEWEAADSVEGLDVDTNNNIDFETAHRLQQGNERVSDTFVTFETGTTGISNNDAVAPGNFDNEFPDAALEGPTTFQVRQNQLVTFEVADNEDALAVYEYQTDSDGNVVLEDGNQLDPNQISFDQTEPGQVANLNTGDLSPGDYVVEFQSSGQVVGLQVLELNLGADTPADVEPGEFVSLPVTADSSAEGNDVEAYFYDVTDTPIEDTSIDDVIHVERDQLGGDGDALLDDVSTTADLNAQAGDEFYAVVRHLDSGVTTQTGTFEVVEQAPEVVEADDVNILSPDLFNVTEPSLFDRGDIIPIELELINGNAATVTFGDLENQNIEIHATVFDPTYDTQDVANNADTTVTVYLNTYQIGQGFVENASADSLDLQPNRPSWIAPGDFVNRNHGFFTDPADSGSALLDASALPRSQNVYATNTTSGGIDIYGGSQGGAVLSPGEEGSAGEFPGLRYDLHATGNFSPYTVLGENREDERDDVNALDIEQRSTDQFRFWTAPGDGSNELAVGDALDTKVGDIQSLIDAGVLTELDANIDENGNVTFTDSVAEDDFIVVQAQSTGLEGVMHEGVLREGLSVAEFLDRDEDHVYTDEFTETTGETLPRGIPGEPNNDLIDFGFNIIENFTSYQARLADADPNEELITPERVNPDLDLEAVIAGVNSDGNLAEYFFPYRVDQDLPVQTGTDTVTPSLTFDADTILEPRGGEQQLESTIYAGVDKNVPRDVNPYLSTNSLGLNESNELDYVQRSVAIDSVHVGPAGLEVPGEESYTITGTSTMAPGTELDISLLSRTGEGTPFAKEQLNVETVEGEGAAPATWEATIDFAETRDDVAIQPGTTFTTDITVTDGDRPLGGADPATGFFTDGVVLADPAVEEFVFDNQQRSNGDVVTIESFDANRVAQITLVDEDGNELGTSAVLNRSVQEQFNIVLDEPITENTEVTATATIVKPEAGESFPDGERTAEVLVEDQQEAFFDVSDLSPTNGQVEQGTTVTAEATVENLGDLEGTQTVTFSVVGTDISVSEEVTLAGGESTTVSFDLPTGDVPANSYTHQIASDDDSVTGGLTVQAPPAPAAFEIVSLSPVEASVTQGDELVVDVSVQNTGEQEGTQDVVLSVSGLGDVGTQSVTLAGGAADSVSFTVDTTDVEAGDYTHSVSVGNASAEGSLTIMEPMPADDSADDNETDNGSSGDGSGPGFGIVVAALALLGAALLAMRRQVE